MRRFSVNRLVGIYFILVFQADALRPGGDPSRVSPFRPGTKLVTLAGSRKTASRAGKEDGDEESIFLKAAWSATEVLGNVAAAVSGPRDNLKDGRSAPLTLDEAANRLRDDYERDYFISGKIDRELYSPNCLFADPFASFEGRERFIDNLQNLGLFITGSDLKLLTFDQDFSNSPPSITTRIMVLTTYNCAKLSIPHLASSQPIGSWRPR